MKRIDLETLANFLDEKYKTPLGFRVGWDGILGLIPGIGTFITTLVSGIIVLQGARMGTPPLVIARMIFNILIDDFMGGIPFLGWIFDFFWKSNKKNVALIRAYQTSPARVKRNTGVFFVLITGTSLLIILAFAVIGGLLTWMAFSALLTSFITPK